MCPLFLIFSVLFSFSPLPNSSLHLSFVITFLPPFSPATLTETRQRNADAGISLSRLPPLFQNLHSVHSLLLPSSPSNRPLPPPYQSLSLTQASPFLYPPPLSFRLSLSSPLLQSSPKPSIHSSCLTFEGGKVGFGGSSRGMQVRKCRRRERNGLCRNRGEDVQGAVSSEGEARGKA